MTEVTDSDELVDIDNLEDFEAEFFNKEEKVEEVEDTEEDTLATEEDTDADKESDEDPDTKEASDEDDGEDESDDESDDEEPEPEPKKGKGKKSFQERINELTRKAREEERAKFAAEQEKNALLQRLEALEASVHKDSKSESVKEQLPQGAPSPDAVDDDGEPLYPLGQFDPQFILDLTKFTIAEERKTIKAEEEKRAEEQKIAAAKAELQASWSNKLEEAEEEIPEIREHIADLVETFSDLDPSYGEYLAMTIMQSDVGPEIMEYLSQNIGEAQKIVGSGPTAATLAIGRLEAKLSRPAKETPNKKVSDAPEPPARVTKGRRQTGSVKPDTDDLNAFEKEFYQK